MKKTVLILMLCLFPLSVQAKSSKLVNTQTSDCDSGYKCVDGRCQACLSGETDCNCGDAAADGNGGCECVKGTFRYDGECIPYCDYTVCAAGLVKTEKDGMCCCKYGSE